MGMTADELLKLGDNLEIREQEVPGGGTVYLKMLTGAEREAWEASNQRFRPQRDGSMERVPNMINLEARLIVRALVDEHGNRMFKDAEAGKIGNLPSAVVKKLFDAVVEMNGISEKAREDLEGNSDAAPSGDSTSDSLSDWDAPSLNSSNESAHVS